MDGVLARGVESLRRLERAGFESVLVGGAVRDLLLGRAPEDVDIATEAPFPSLSELFPGGKPVGPEGKRVFLLPCGMGHCEITSFDGGSLELDLARRDFTVNALALRSTGELVGTRRGRRDIALRILRFNGRAADRLGEDPLRALRLSRFAAVLPGFTVDGGAFSRVRAAVPSLVRCAPERVGREMRLGLGGDPCVFLRSLAASGMFHVLRPLVGERRGEFFLLVAMKALDGGAEPILRRTALLASSRRRSAFPDLEGEEAARRTLSAWRWPGPLRSGVASLVRWRNAPAEALPLTEMASLLLSRGISFWGSLFALADATPQNAVARRRVAENRERFVRLAVRRESEEERIPSGAELMDRFALSSGPDVGKLVRELRMEHLLRGFLSKEEAFERGAQLLKKL